MMVFFTEIRATEHYIEEHQKDVPWHKVVEILFKTKNPRKKGEKFEIEKDGYYLLFEIRDNIIYVINAKRTK
ncbi:MAG: hypothetical protein ABIE94_06700 [archaeon]